ncbi:MAG: class B sortase [Acutalibacter sp.]|nr:class B sortase [Acutalibacter sp.]
MKRKLLIAGAAFFAALFLFSGFMLYREYADSKQSADAFESLAGLVLEESPIQSDDTADSPGDTTEETEPQITPAEKYGLLYEQNSDFVGWITIDGTNINYPVMQTPDNPNFYLKHNFEKEYSNHGVPYVQENCTLGASDNVIIYGHHMIDGSMFADLCKYESEDFYREHKTIRFDTLSEYGEYEIVTVFKTVAYSPEGFQYNRFVNAEDKAAFDEFLAGCNALRLYDTGVSTEYGEKLICLSTCEYSHTNGRLVVLAKKVGGNA